MTVGLITGTDGLIVVVVALVVLFGGSQLPKLARNIASAGREFRQAQQDAEHEAAVHPPLLASRPQHEAPGAHTTPPVPGPAASPRRDLGPADPGPMAG